MKCAVMLNVGVVWSGVRCGLCDVECALRCGGVSEMVVGGRPRCKI